MTRFVLCYHKVGPISEEGRRLNIEPGTLRQHARFFRRRNYVGAMCHELSRPATVPTVTFTFDDTYISAVQRVPSILEEFGFRGAFPIVPECVGSTSRWDGDASRPLADWNEILALQNRGHEIVNHTLTHPRLADLDRWKQLAEIKAARDAMRGRGIDSTVLCFPYGSHNQHTFEAMNELGFTVGLALGSRPAKPGYPVLAVPRIVLSCSDKLPKLLYKMFLRPLLP